jgi:hypothetical protein
MTKDVHISEVRNFLKCRLLWFWTAPPPRGLGLTQRRAEGAQYFGTLVHQALQVGYDTGVSFPEAFRKLYLAASGSGRDDEELQLGLAMLQGYSGWAKSQDADSQYLAMETEWNNIRIAPRVTLGGTFDALVKRPDGLWIMDFKTTRYTSNAWTARDLQASAYVYAARKMYGPEVRGIIFRFLLKKKPRTYDELILKNGSITTRKNLKGLTTSGEYHRALAVATLRDMAEEVGLVGSDPLERFNALLDGTQDQQEWYSTFKERYVRAQQVYYPQLQELKGPSRFYWDVEEYRSDEQLQRIMKHVIVPAAKEMTSKRKKKWVGPTGLGAAFALCGNCKFKDPCRLALDGANYQDILQEEFELRDVYR